MRPDSRSVSDWLRRARSDLAVARAPVGPEMMRETLCYQAQQAAEKAIKAVLIHVGTEPPRTHNIGRLLLLVPATTLPPDDIARAARLTDYAMEARYPSGEVPVTEEEYGEALRLAEAVVAWAAEVIGADNG